MRLFIFLGVLAALAFTPFHQTYAQTKNKTPPFELGKGLELLDALGFGVEEPTPEEAKKISRELVNHYYKSCMETPSTLFQDIDMYEICGCAAGNMMQTMTVDEILEMFKDTKEGLVQRQRFMALSYMPCTEPSLFKFIKRKCLADKDIRKSLKNEKSVCICLARDISPRIPSFGINVIRKEEIDPADNPDVQAIFSKYLTSSGYETFSHRSFKKCLRRYELLWPGK